MRLKFCTQCGESFDYEKITRSGKYEVVPGELRPMILEEYTYQCHSCEHWQHVVDTNYNPNITTQAQE